LRSCSSSAGRCAASRFVLRDTHVVRAACGTRVALLSWWRLWKHLIYMHCVRGGALRCRIAPC
jgi:hypothetical protein